MKRLFKRAGLCLCLLSFNTLYLSAQLAKHVILISIDGFHPDMYLDKSWPAPNLRELVKKGTYAAHMKSVFPSYTYPAHIAMVTGALPARSGVNFNQPLGSHGEWFWFADAIRVPTLWCVLKGEGLNTAAIEWPGSVTSDITWDIPEIWDIKHPGDRVTEARKFATQGLIEDVEQNATGKLDSTNFNDKYFSLDENAGKAAAYIFITKKPSFMAVHFATVDGFEHSQGRDGDSVRMAVATVDKAIGCIMAAVNQSGLNESTAIIIVGDHGFSTVHQVMRPNLLIKNIPAVFIASGGSAFLYRYRTTKKEDIPGIVKAVTDSFSALPVVNRKLFRIIDRSELDRMGADSAALLALGAVSGTVFSSSTRQASITNHGPGTLIQQNPQDGLLIPANGGHHGYDPDLPDMWTGFIAEGAGIRKGQKIASLTVTDIAPIIARLLRIDFKTPDGKLPNGLIEQQK